MIHVGILSEALLEMFERESALARFVLSEIEPKHLDFRPLDNMRSLRELANHLAQIPSIDIAFYTKEIENFEAAQIMEHKLWKDDIPEILSVFDKGTQLMKTRLSGLSDEEFQEKKLKAFYESGPDNNWIHYLSEIICHIVMHKMQVWMYLRLQGAPVSMWTYYGIKR